MLNVLDALLSPLTRMLVARGVLFPDLVERLKAHYVQAALSLNEAKATDSRLSVMTGLQRRDIARLRDFAPKPERPNHLARLVALWCTEPGYQMGDQPRAIPRNGPAPSFEALARQVTQDVHSRTMLDTLIATGTVGLDGSMVRLEKMSYQPLAGTEDQIAYLAENMGDHIAAATENVLAETPPHFERAVHYSGLTDTQVDALESYHRAVQMQLFEEISRRAAAMKRGSGTGSTRLRAGSYFYRCKGEAE